MLARRALSTDVVVLPILLLSLGAAVFSAKEARAGIFPPGDYIHSCTDIAVDGAALSATCKDFHQRLAARTVLPDFGTCVGNIGNVDGVLRCIRSNGPVPRGSYLETCTDTKLDVDNNLFSRCRNFNQDWQGTQLHMSGCMEPVSNVDGHLSCTRTDLHGTFSQTCWNIRTEGKSVLATCRAMSGAPVETRLDDISKCQVDAAGRSKLFNTDGRLGCAIIFTGGNTTAPPGSLPPPGQCQPGNPHGHPNCGPSTPPSTGPTPGPFPFTPQTAKPAIQETKALQPATRVSTSTEPGGKPQ